ncbi:MAG: glycosyltransferase [Bacteroidales bacterium]|jgi:GT2 family glycosyltransferase|nr:glycosyltransferase [Bacteroidales bacterium]
MQLSIIIVNYKVKHFLAQCLTSVLEATQHIEAEIFVIDNNSNDGSVEMLRECYPQVQTIDNQCNVGFSRANNQAMRLARGNYVLLLNPDTLVQADTFEKCLRFMDEHPDAGGLGVKMVNGKGEFLPESKRGLPLPGVAFYKIFGLSKFFPKSKKFGTYHLTYLDNNEIHSVEVLSGAFMLMRKSVLDQTGYLDEDYFMYGEDIDLSCRIIRSGYKNYYFPETQIIHYKGESTKKNSVNYVFVFYKAMQIFAKKQFSSHNAKLFNFIINMAIWFRALLALLKRLAVAAFLPLLDFAAIYGGLLLLSSYWETNVLSPRGSAFPDHYLYIILPLYILFWLTGIALCRGYCKPLVLSRTNRGIILGSGIILLIYALLPESFRFSRAVILLGSMWTIITLNGIRYLLSKLGMKNYRLGGTRKQRIAVVGSAAEAVRVAELTQMFHNKNELLRLILTENATSQSETQNMDNSMVIGNITQIAALVKLYRINELIFCGSDLSTARIMALMHELQPLQPEFKIAPASDKNIIIGSNAIHIKDELFHHKGNSLNCYNNRLKKRLFDFISALLLLVASPLSIWLLRYKKDFLGNIFAVLTGAKSWVSYASSEEMKTRKGIFSPAIILGETPSEESVQKANRLYAENYDWKLDLKILRMALAARHACSARRNRQ